MRKTLITHIICCMLISTMYAQSNTGLATAIESEDIQLLEQYLEKEPESELREQAQLVLEGQKAFLSGRLNEIDIAKFKKSNFRYGEELVEIAVAIKASSTPNILSEVTLYANQGKIGELFSRLIDLQSIVDNRLLRHTLAQLLYDASKNLKMPGSLAEVKFLQDNMSLFQEKVDSTQIKLGSVNGKPDFGNVMVIIPPLTMSARSRSVLTKIPMNEFQAGRIGFDGILQLMQKMTPLAVTINSQVITGAKVLVASQYSEFDIKGRYAILQWLEYLIDKAEFGVTLRVGEVDIDLRKSIEAEQNHFLKDFGNHVLAAMENVAGN